MPFIGPLISLHRKDNELANEVAILDAFAIDYRIVRRALIPSDDFGGPVLPKEVVCFGAIYHRSPETAEELIDRVTYNVVANDYLVARYRQSGKIMRKTFRQVLFGAGSYGSWNTVREEAWDGVSPLCVLPFMLSTERLSEIRDFIWTIEES